LLSTEGRAWAIKLLSKVPSLTPSLGAAREACAVKKVAPRTRGVALSRFNNGFDIVSILTPKYYGLTGLSILL
jgi:hypothetical protein